MPTFAPLDLRHPPPAGAQAPFAPGFGPRLLLTIDTEEEFDWSRPLDRTSHALDHLPRLAKFQQFCETHGVAPVWLVDFPVASDPRSAALLRPALAEGRAAIGMQLHPWVSPPFEEVLSPANSFAGNLPPALERAKLVRLRDLIVRMFGVAPQVYRAGRYGVGPHTARLLAELGLKADTSVRPGFDYRREGGPDFTRHPLCPWWIDRAAGLVELPLTTISLGPLRHLAWSLAPLTGRSALLRGLLARTGLLNRVPLTPEGVTPAEAVAAIDQALADGLDLLVLSFHSPSLRPGSTPYVRDHADLDRLYDWWRTVLAHCAAIGVRPARLDEVLAGLCPPVF